MHFFICNIYIKCKIKFQNTLKKIIYIEKPNTEDWHYYLEAFTETGFLTQCLNAGMWSDFLCFSHLLNKLSDALLTDEQI